MSEMSSEFEPIEEDDGRSTVIIVIAVLAVLTLIGVLRILRTKYLKMMAAYDYAEAVSSGMDIFVKEAFGNHLIYKQVQQRAHYWRLNIEFFPRCTSLGNTVNGLTYHLDLEFGHRDMILMNEPLPVQSMCLVEFTLLKGSAGGYSGDVSFGITVKPPPVASFPGEYPHSYGLSSAGYSLRGNADDVTRIKEAAYGAGDIISFAIDRILGTVCVFKNGLLKDTVTMPFVQITDERGWGAFMCVATNGIDIDVGVNAGTEPFRGTMGADLKSIFFENMGLGWSINEELAGRIQRGGRRSLILSHDEPLADEISSESSESQKSAGSPRLSQHEEISRTALDTFKLAVRNMTSISRFGTKDSAMERIRKKVKRLESKRDPKTITYPTKEITQANVSRCRRKGCKCGCWILDGESIFGLCKCGHAGLYHRALPGTRDVDTDDNGRDISREARLDVAVSHLDLDKKPSKWRRVLFDGHRFFYHCRTHEVTYEPHFVKIPSRAIRPLSHASCDTCDGLRKLELDLFSPAESIRERRKARKRALFERAQRMKMKMMSRRALLKQRQKENISGSTIGLTPISKLSSKQTSSRKSYGSQRVSSLIMTRMGGEDTSSAGSLRSSVRGPLVSDVHSSRQAMSDSDLSPRSSKLDRVSLPSSIISGLPSAKSHGSEVKRSRSHSPASLSSSRSRSSHDTPTRGKTTGRSKPSSKDASLIGQPTDNQADPMCGRATFIEQPTDNQSDPMCGRATVIPFIEQPADVLADPKLGRATAIHLIEQPTDSQADPEFC